MKFGLGILAQVIENTGASAPAWIVETMNRADDADLLTRLTGDVVSGIRFDIQVPAIPVRVAKLTLFTIGPFNIRIIGREPGVFDQI